MSQEEIIKGNILISEFMGPHYESTFRGKGRMRLYVGKRPNERANHEAHELEFHESWDWLMPVVEKIESLTSHGDFKYIVSIQGGYCCVSEDGDGEMIHTQDWESPKIQVVWETVVKFITWHNSNSPKN